MGSLWARPVARARLGIVRSIVAPWRNTLARSTVMRVCAKCFSFRKCHVILEGSESFVISNYSQYYHEERRGKIKLINFVSFLPRLLFLVCSSCSPVARESKHDILNFFSLLLLNFTC